MLSRIMGKMSEETMSAIVGKTLAAAQTCVFGFQGGKPTLAGLSFYKRFTHLVEEQKRPEQKVAYTIQTNGTELDEEWFAFLKEKDFLVGLSMAPGVRKTHDENRVDHKEEGTFSQVFQCALKLEEYRIPFHVLCVLNAPDGAPALEPSIGFLDAKGPAAPSSTFHVWILRGRSGDRKTGP